MQGHPADHRPRPVVLVAVAAGLVVALVQSGADNSPARAPAVGHTRLGTAHSAELAAFGVPTGAALAPAPATAPRVPPINLIDYRECLKLVNQFTAPDSAFQAGWADAAKLGGAAPTGFPAPSIATIDALGNANAGDFRGHGLACAELKLHLNYHGRRQLPPIRATFLAFGVEPVTATVVISQDGPQPIRFLAYQDQGPVLESNASTAPGTAVATGRVTLRVTNVSVNGTRLNVGPRCRTAADLTTPGNRVAPGQMLLTGGLHFGDPLPGFGITGEGTVAGRVTIPPFTGCATPSGENLDPLLTASVAGPGNYIRLFSGQICPGFPLPSQCNALGFNTNVVFTVKHGGRFTAASPFTVSVATTSAPAIFFNITCRASAASGVFPDTAGPLRGGLATFRVDHISMCRGDDGSTWSITERGGGFFSSLQDLGGGVMLGQASSLLFNLTGRGRGTGTRGVCHVVMEGLEVAQYTNAGSVLALAPFGQTEAMTVDKTSCRDVPFFVSPGERTGADVAATYHLKPGGITVTSSP